MKKEKLTKEEWLKWWAAYGSKRAHAAMTPEQRKERGRKAAAARWGKKQ